MSLERFQGSAAKKRSQTFMDELTKEEKLELVMLSVLNVVCIFGPIIVGILVLLNIYSLYFAGK